MIAPRAVILIKNIEERAGKDAGNDETGRININQPAVHAYMLYRISKV